MNMNDVPKNGILASALVMISVSDAAVLADVRAKGCNDRGK
ncbi:hypothetical protein [Rhizobium paranaense]|uniref:Uncharacterized protein n=1 Tax=Rhizobium paranaense TaxID=1650438 RepID=A0A7W8XU11_9HYPH|nr:hypothetical protein [Rhizobium paranaense]MBB5575588.1 hypothetical protein [Rhizobium paranaense]